MNGLLIPVKEFSKAKQRLAGHFSPEERKTLAEALLEDFFGTVARTRGIDRIFVVSAEPSVLERARGMGWEAIPEARQVSESESVDFASRWCAERGVRALLRLPIDLPLIEPRDIENLFEQLPPAPAVVLVPSRDGDGTNALLRKPPTQFGSHFGPGSFARHLAEAERCGARIEVARNARLELDVDEMEDLLVLAACPLRRGATSGWIARCGLSRVGQDQARFGELAAAVPNGVDPESANR